MSGFLCGLGLASALLVAPFQLATATDAAAPAPPSSLFGPLFIDVEQKGVYPDSKTFADAQPRRSPAEILSDYRPGMSNDALRAFVAENFELPTTAAATLQPTPRPLRAHIAALWSVLARPPQAAPPYSSHLSMRYPYVVPGGRFREVYYWDSYFTLLGLTTDSRADLAHGLVDNFADLIGRYGHVPNGARTYYLSRSQPPVFFLMAGRVGGGDVADGYAHYLPALRREYRFWMDGEERARPGRPVAHVVRFPDGEILNRYWDAASTPRDESYREDSALSSNAGRPPQELYRDIRAAAESGWDFSSRWMGDGHSLATLQTTSITPVDLNSLLFGLEGAIAQGCARAGDQSCRLEFVRRAARRKRAINRYLWNGAAGEYLDYDWMAGRSLDHPSAAMLYPLFVGAASPSQAQQVAGVTGRILLAQGGLRTTTVRTGQQWDSPNGWAPLQWIGVTGLDAYGHHELANEIATRWVSTVCRAYLETGKLLEKYDVEEVRPGGGGEYPLQDGFGWTNGVTEALMVRPGLAGRC